jgi:hypothetical protein
MVTIDVVDRRVAHRPASLAQSAWDSAQSIEAIEDLGQQLLSHTGSDVTVFILGRDADVYVATHESEAAPFAKFASAAVATFSTGMNSSRAAVGVSFASEPSMRGRYADLVQLGNAVAFSYAPDLGKASIANAGSPALDLDTMVAIASGKPIYLSGVSFTSAASLGASALAQAQHVEGLFAALGPRRADFPLVNVARLHDLTEVACSAYASEQGLGPDDPELGYVCASGMRDPSGAAKQAWYSLLAASATYAQP